MLGKAALAVLCLLSIVHVGISSGQEERPNPLTRGASALEFGISENFTLTSFDGATISLKKLVSERTALRGFVLLNALSTDSNVTTGDSVASEKRGRDSYSVSVGIDWLRYLSPERRWSFYMGFGPSVGFGKVKDNASFDNANVQESHTDVWSVGVNGVFGGEWFVSRVVGIHAEYGLGAGYDSYTQKNTFSGTRTERDTDAWYLSSGGVRFGLSAYF